MARGKWLNLDLNPQRQLMHCLLRSIRFSPLLLVVLLVGCDLVGLGGDLDLQTDKTAYAPEAEVRLTLRNETGRTVGLGPLDCAALQMQQDGEWTEAPESLRYCAAILLGLESGEQMEARHTLDASFEPGTYRFVFSVGDYDDYPGQLQVITSNAFEIR